ncbi:MAG: hypothetical protein Q8Q73_05160 [Stagnimonas sp.]|nr:hypothetical protein [Stagnimonas sp.]
MIPAAQNIVVATLDRSTELRVENLAREFKGFAKKTAENVLGMAETVVTARTLEDAAYSAFCSQIELTEGSSMIRKLEVIGKKLDVLRKHVAVLPPSWTTIYSLARMDAEDIEEVAETVLSPAVTKPQLEPVVAFFTGKAPSAPKAALVPAGTFRSITIRFSGRITAEQIAAMNEIILKARSVQAEVALSMDLDQMLGEQPANDAVSAVEEVFDVG